MPIPNLKNVTVENAQDVDEAYSKLGWSRELTFRWVAYNPGMNIFTVSTYQAKADRCSCLPEDDPRAARYTYIQFTESGIVKTCGLCRRTQAYNLLDKFQLIETKRVSKKQALEICHETHQFLIPELRQGGAFTETKKILDIPI